MGSLNGLLSGAPFFENFANVQAKRDLFVHALFADHARCQSPDARSQQIIWAFALKERRRSRSGHLALPPMPVSSPVPILRRRNSLRPSMLAFGEQSGGWQGVGVGRGLGLEGFAGLGEADFGDVEPGLDGEEAGLGLALGVAQAGFVILFQA